MRVVRPRKGLGRGWRGGPEAQAVFKEGRNDWGTPLGATGVRVFGDAGKRKKTCPGGTKLGIKSHFLPGVGQRSHLSSGDCSSGRSKRKQRLEDIPKTGSGGCTSLAEPEKWPRNPSAAALAAPSGYFMVRGCNSQYCLGTRHQNLESTVSGECWWKELPAAFPEIWG